jgi:hypothetical protein
VTLLTMSIMDTVTRLNSYSARKIAELT